MTLTLPRFEKAKILVIGDIMLDRYWSGATSRISPEAPVPVVKVGDIEDRLGGAANVAKNIAALGCKVAICGAIGNDEAGEKIKTLLTDSTIQDLCISTPSQPTITKLRVLSRHQQLLRMDFEETIDSTQIESAMLEILEKNLPEIDAVIISDYAKGTIHSSEKIIQQCQKHQVSVFIDPKGKDFTRYKGATLLTPNLSELEVIAGKCTTLDEIREKTEQLRQELSLQAILVTLSEKGMMLVQENKKSLHIATSAKDVYDVTGAGDTVIATLTAASAAGSDLVTAMRLANTAAGVVVGKLGTSTVSADELRHAIALHQNMIDKEASSLEHLCQQVESCRQRGETIVFTNGCFDILHAGHVRYLKQAAALGDRLIVGVNSDDSIRRLKGEERPIVNLTERMEVLSSLTCVDWVIAFQEDTPAKLISHLLPDILAKGGDYAAEQLVGYETVTKNGGKVKILPFVDGCSTSSIIEKIKSLNNDANTA